MTSRTACDTATPPRPRVDGYLRIHKYYASVPLCFAVGSTLGSTEEGNAGTPEPEAHWWRRRDGAESEIQGVELCSCELHYTTTIMWS